jgi:hypothetical protein
MANLRAWACLGFFSLVWLLPVGFQGLFHVRFPGAPGPLVTTTSVSCLFLKSSDYVPVQYIQVLLPGATSWVTEDDRRYFGMSPFGYRTRFDEMMRKQLASPRALGELAAFVRTRHAKVTGVAPAAVRFVTGVVLPEPAPCCRFQKPPLEAIDPIRREVWFTQVYAPVARELLKKRA